MIEPTLTTADGDGVGGRVDGDSSEWGNVDHDCALDAVEGLGPAMAAITSEDWVTSCECVFNLLSPYY